MVVANTSGPLPIDRLRQFWHLEHLGAVEVEGERCEVVAGFAPRDEARELRRLYVSTAKGFAVVRAEHVVIHPETGPVPGITHLTSATDLREYGAGIWLPHQVRVDMWCPSDEELLGWDWTKRFRVRELAVNEGFKWEPQGWLFPITKRAVDTRNDRLVWDPREVQGELEGLSAVAEDPFGQAVLEHADDLQAWMLRPAGSQEP